MDCHHVISNECNLPLPKEYMHVLRKCGRNTYDSRQRQEQMHEPSMYSRQANTGDHDHDDGSACSTPRGIGLMHMKKHLSIGQMTNQQ